MPDDARADRSLLQISRGQSSGSCLGLKAAMRPTPTSAKKSHPRQSNQRRIDSASTEYRYHKTTDQYADVMTQLYLPIPPCQLETPAAGTPPWIWGLIARSGVADNTLIILFHDFLIRISRQD